MHNYIEKEMLAECLIYLDRYIGKNYCKCERIIRTANRMATIFLSVKIRFGEYIELL